MSKMITYTQRSDIMIGARVKSIRPEDLDDIALFMRMKAQRKQARSGKPT